MSLFSLDPDALLFTPGTFKPVQSVALALHSVSLLFLTVLTMYVYWRRMYLPFKVRQMPWIIGSMWSAWLFSVGASHAAHLLPNGGTEWECPTLGVVIQVFMGAWLFAVLLIYRLMRLYVLLVLKRPNLKQLAGGLMLVYTLSGVYLAFMVWYGTTSVKVWRIDGQEFRACNLNSFAVLLGFCVTLVYMAGIWISIVLTLRLQSAFNESRQLRVLGLVYTFIFFIYAVASYLSLPGHFAWAAFLAGNVGTALLIATFAALGAQPLWKSITMPAEYSASIHLELQRNSRQRVHLQVMGSCVSETFENSASTLDSGLETGQMITI